MDNLELYATGLRQLELVRSFSVDINLKFGTDKSATAHIRKDEMNEDGNIILANGIEIQNLGLKNTFRYLEMQHTFEIRPNKTKIWLKMELNHV